MAVDPTHPDQNAQGSIDASFRAAYAPGETVAPQNNPYPGASLYGTGFSGVVGTGTGGNILYTTFSGGRIVDVRPGTPTTDTAALGASFGLNPSAASVTGSGWAIGSPAAPSPGLGAGAYLFPGVGGASSPPLGGTGSQGQRTQPGGTVSGALSSLLNGLSHTTAGLNWSTIALWLAVLAGGYIVLGSLVGGKRRRR